MFDENSLIGLDVFEAEELIKKYGDFDITIKDNFKKNELCNTKIVCAAKIEGKKIELVCGEFYVGLRR